MVNKWLPKESNTVLEATCSPGKVFADEYVSLKEWNYESLESVYSKEVIIKGQKIRVYLLVLDNPVSFEGVTKKEWLSP